MFLYGKTKESFFNKMSQNNALIVGQYGCGKTLLIKTFMRHLYENKETVYILHDRPIVEYDNYLCCNLLSLNDLKINIKNLKGFLFIDDFLKLQKDNPELLNLVRDYIESKNESLRIYISSNSLIDFYLLNNPAGLSQIYFGYSRKTPNGLTGRLAEDYGIDFSKYEVGDFYYAENDCSYLYKCTLSINDEDKEIKKMTVDIPKINLPKFIGESRRKTAVETLEYLLSLAKKDGSVFDHLRIGQALVNVSYGSDLFYLENDDLLERIKRELDNSEN